MPSFSIPLSGLTASSEALSTTANNLANLNTIGYKDEQIQFADLFYQNFGSNGAGNGLLTQEAAPNSTASIQQDGTSSGTLVNFNIGGDGTITGTFSNNKTATIGQIALASFADEQGLSHVGNNDFAPTLASGQPTIGGPGTGGLGTISGGALEQSNVDIATEFANLIIAQRSYEANARVVTTFDEVAQATIALKP